MDGMLETERLGIRELHVGDAAFILELVNEPSWLRFIGDKGVRTLEDARAYIENGPMDMYARLGFGLWLVETKEGGIPIGICGLIQRDELEDVDIGFAFLPGYWGRGYAVEADARVMSHGEVTLGLQRIIAITSQDNPRSGRLLEKLGFRFERMIRMASDGPELEQFAARPGTARIADATH